MAKAKGLHESWSRLASARNDDWYVVIHGNLARVVRRLFDPPPRSHKPKTAISGFSHAARLRLLRFIATVDWSAVGDCRFITLTYPDEVVERTYKDRAVERYLFCRMLDKFANKPLSVIWRTEWKERKSGMHVGYLMPHLHLLVFSLGFISNETVRQWWKKIIRWDGVVSTDVRKAPEGGGAAYYVAKYTAKVLHLDTAPYLNRMCMTGRQWGTLRKSLIPLQPCVASRCLTEGEIELAKQLGRRLFSRYGEFGEGGFTLLGADRVAELKEIFKNALAE